MRNKLPAILLALVCAALGQTAEPTAEEQYAAKVLDEVWQEVARNHFRKDFDARYRKSVYEKYRPKILASPDRAALVDRLNEMLSAVGDSHLWVYGPGRGASLPQPRPVEKPGDISRPVDPGFTTLTDSGRILVRDVRPGSAAAAENIRPGDELLAADGLDLHAESVKTARIPLGHLTRSILERGGAGSICTVRIRSSEGRERELRLERTVSGARFFNVINLPRMALRYEAKMLASDVGYVRFNLFVPEAVRRFRKDLRNGVLKKAGKLIIDLRGNPGGVLLTAEWLGSWCVPARMPMGTLVVDGVELHPVSEPQENGFRGPLAILVDGETMSTGELFAAAVQDAKAGMIVGTKTPGKCLPSMFYTLPSGFRIQTVSGNALRPSGRSLERLGVTPDATAANAFRDGKDLAIETALKILTGEASR